MATAVRIRLLEQDFVGSGVVIVHCCLSTLFSVFITYSMFLLGDTMYGSPVSLYEVSKSGVSLCVCVVLVTMHTVWRKLS